MRNYYVRRKEAGLCVRCEAPAVSGKTRCADCAKEESRRVSTAQVHRYHKTKKKQQENGLCIYCDKPHRPNRLTCADCAEDGAEATARMRNGRKARGVCVDCAKPSDSYYCFNCGIDARIRHFKFSDTDKEIVRQMLRNFNGICQGCGTTDPGGMGQWHIDHDHITNRFRGILCNACNTILGYAREDETVLFGVIKYLRQHKDFTPHDICESSPMQEETLVTQG